MSRKILIPNVKCHLCGKDVYRSASELKQSKTGFYYCSRFCKNIQKTGEIIHSIPKDSPIFKATLKAYGVDRQPEYLCNISLYKTKEEHIKTLGSIMIVANARVNGDPALSSKTPKDIDFIRSCYDNILIKDIEGLSEIQDDDLEWESISLKCWNDNDITYKVE